MNLQLNGTVAYVTAASKGLGLASAKRLAAEGANVVISSRSTEHLNEAKAEIIKQTGTDADALFTVKCDITDKAAVREAIGTAVERFGGLDVLVNNHGGPPAIPFEEADEGDWDDAFELAVKSNIWHIESALPHLQDSDHGAIVTVTSASAQEPSENHALSNVFRLGLYGLSKTIAVEYPSVRSNVVAPRFVMTDRVEYKIEKRAEYRDISFEEALETRETEVILDRAGDPEEFGDAVAFVASPRASYTTGDVIHVDGGWKRGVF